MTDTERIHLGLLIKSGVEYIVAEMKGSSDLDKVSSEFTDYFVAFVLNKQ